MYIILWWNSEMNIATHIIGLTYEKKCELSGKFLCENKK